MDFQFKNFEGKEAIKMDFQLLLAGILPLIFVLLANWQFLTCFSHLGLNNYQGYFNALHNVSKESALAQSYLNNMLKDNASFQLVQQYQRENGTVQFEQYVNSCTGIGIPASDALYIIWAVEGLSAFIITESIILLIYDVRGRSGNGRQGQDKPNDSAGSSTDGTGG